MGYKSRDFQCNACDHVFNDLVQNDDSPDACPACGSATGFVRVISAPLVIKTITVDYPGSKRFKAGYVHTHGDRPAEKAGSQVSMYNPKSK